MLDSFFPDANGSYLPFPLIRLTLMLWSSVVLGVVFPFEVSSLFKETSITPCLDSTGCIHRMLLVLYRKLYYYLLVGKAKGRGDFFLFGGVFWGVFEGVEGVYWFQRI